MIKNKLVKPLILALFFLLVLYEGNAQQTITGNVTNSTNGTGVENVTIQLKNSKTAAKADANGAFKITVPSLPAVLTVSSVGYSPQNVTVTTATPVNISLVAVANTLSDVVVIGYGTSKKKDLTGAVSNISAKDLNQGPSTNLLQQIAGKAAGVNITQTGSEPGGSPSVRIRGITSLIGGSDPLIVVDGIQGGMDLLKQVPPNEIESVDILKDASATAIYGSRGAPGVIIVTTKKSKAGTTSLEYTSSVSIDAIPKKLDMLSSDEWWRQAQRWGVPATANHGSNTDWFDIMTRNGVTQNHSLSFGGGAKNFNYRASVAAVLQDGVVIKSKYSNYIARLQATQKALDEKLTLSLNVNSSTTNTLGSPTGIGRAAFSSILIANSYLSKPTDPVYNTDGTYYTDPTVFQYINPYAVAQTMINEGGTDNLFGALRADLQLAKGLTAGWFGSWRKVTDYWGTYIPSASTISFAIENKGIANVTNKRQDEKLMDISLNYKKTFGNHTLDAIGVYEWQAQTYQGNYAQKRGFINDITTYNAMINGDVVLPTEVTSYKNDRKLISFLGRVNYSYLNKYLLTVSLRRDGSTVFGDNYHWGNFPGGSIAWRISQEPFMKNQKTFSDLKLRVGYGVTGNQQGLLPNVKQLLVQRQGTTFFAGSTIPNFGIKQNENKDLRWETKKQTNIGLDFGLFNNKLTGTIELYTATTKDLLFEYSVPTPPNLWNTTKANVGSLQNKGIELQLNHKTISNKNTTLTLGFNVSFMKNKIIELEGTLNGAPIGVGTNYISWGAPNSMLIIGQPIGTFNILHHAGRDPITGEELVVDQNNDGTIDQGNLSLDRVILGSALPTYTFAFNPSFTYKNWDISMLWRGSGGNKAYNSLRQSLSLFENVGKSNLLNSARTTGLYTSKYGSDLWLEDASFIRFDNLTLGYRFNVKDLKYVSGVRLSAVGNNLALITNYSGLDPELLVNGSSDGNFGKDNGIYPRTRSFSIGVNVIFK